ncbi:MAG: hypothetical protein LQ349_003008 [Xanthoria aureola]|nr:MAG: hypothetical protein LQ349_003008 [Xanthoria aureola]
MAATPRPLSAEDLTKRRLPSILQNPQRTSSRSISPQTFVGLMAKWDSFEREVRENFHRQPWAGSQRVLTWDHDLINRERVKCASEDGVTGRFLQQVGQVMTCVGSELRMHLYFGDWQGDRDSGVPDVTIWDQNSVAKIAGEMKTPWTLNLGRLMSETDPDRPTREDFEQTFTLCAGQVANYMKLHQYQYGFLSTYDETVFFKQETHRFTGAWASANGVPQGTERNVLYYSNAIHHDTDFIPCNPAVNQDHRAFIDKVTLRECMLYLMTQVEEDPGSHPYRNRDTKWTKPAAQTSTGGKAKNLAPDPSKGKLAATPSAPKSSGSNVSTQQHYSRGTGSLADKMSGLRIEDKAVEKAPVPRVRIRWSGSRREYMWTSSQGVESAVDKHHVDKNKTLWVKIRGLTYLAILA